MKTLNNEIIITRGETFTMDKLFQNKDGSPYIISNQLTNPYWLITVASSEFEQSNRHSRKWYLPLTDYPRFSHTNVVNLQDIVRTANSFTDITDAIEGKFIAVLNIDGQVVKIEEDDFVYYLDNIGNREYKYARVVDGKIQWYDYECRLTKLFTREETSELTQQNYLYSISLVDDATPALYKPLLQPTKLTVKNYL